MSAVRHVTLNSGSLSAAISVPQNSLIHQQDASGVTDVHQLLTDALVSPVGLPALSECVVPGDRVAVVVDPETPDLIPVLQAVARQLHRPADEAVSVSLLLPEDPAGQNWKQLKADLPPDLTEVLAVHEHDPRDETQRGYLGTSAGGERIYLNRVLLDADVIVNVGIIGFDSLLGYRGTSSVMFPAFSDAATIQEACGQGHPELTPDDRRPMRDLVDEVAWLLGTQFSVQVIPDMQGRAARILAGAPDQVQSAGQTVLEQLWRLSVDELFELVLISVPGGALFGWKQLGLALDVASRIVVQGGRIALIADVPTPEGPGATMLRRCQDPEDLLKPLRRDPPSDAVEMTQLIHALRRARLYLLSHVPAEIVEELGMYSLSSAHELQRLVDQCRNTAVIRGASFAWADVAASAAPS